MQDVANGTSLHWQPNGPAALDRFHIVRNEPVFISVRRSSVNRRQTEYAGPNLSLPGVVFHIALADYLRPFQRRLSGVVGWTCLGALRVRLCIRAVNVLGGGIDKG